MADEAGVPVDAVESEIQQQVDRVRAELRQARIEQDDYLVDLHEAELDGLVRTAAAHGLRVDREPGDVDLTALEERQPRIA